MASSSHEKSWANGVDAIENLFTNPEVLREWLPLDNDSSNPDKRHTFVNPAISPSNCPNLQGLPLEVYGEILCHLTIQELTDLRRASQYTRSAIDNVLKYQELYTRASSAIRGCLATCSASRITLDRLHYALTHPECSVCTDVFATNLSFFSGDRVCIDCLRNNSSLYPLEVHSILKKLHETCVPTTRVREILRVQPAIRGIRGRQAIRRKGPSRRMMILPSEIPEKEVALLDAKEKEILFGVPNSDEEVNRRQVVHNPLICRHIESDIRPRGPRQRLGWTWSYVEKHPPNENLYRTSIYLPFWDLKTNTLDKGTLCKNCMFECLFLEFG